MQDVEGRDWRSFFRSLPKCEHHMHLEGALTPELLFQLAQKNGISLPSDDDGAFASPATLAARYERFSSLDDFLHYYYIGLSVLIDAHDFEALAWSYFQRASADGVAHAELFFDPQAHLSRGVSYAAVCKGFAAARSRARSELGISSLLICCFLRHLPVRDCEAVFRREDVRESVRGDVDGAEGERGGVVGIGLDSSESPFPPAPFAQLFRSARERGLRTTAHAGEEGPASFIRSALDELRVERIDHGIRLAEDEELLHRVAASGTLLTVCPLSNLFLRCVTSVAELPIRRFLQAGVRFSINSDDPAYFGNNYLLDNYCAVQEAFQLSVDEWALICEHAIQGSWCGDARKALLLERLKDAIARARLQKGTGAGSG